MNTPEAVATETQSQILPPAGMLRRTFSFPVFLGALLVAGTFAAVRLNLQSVASASSGSSHVSIFEGDTWYHIISGEQILRTHTWPTEDTYSFTAQGNDFLAYEWLGDVVWALTNRLGGLGALTGLLVALAAAIMLLLYYYATLRCGDSKAAFVACVPLLPLASASFTLRPQLLGYIFLLLLMICLEHFRQGRSRALWLLPPIFLLWVNTHGSFILGFVVLGVYWASGLVGFKQGSLEAVRWTPPERGQLAAVGLLSVLALAVTPYGTRLAATPLDIILHSSLGVARIVEYESLDAFSGLWKLFLILLLLFVLAQVTVRPTYRVEEIVLLMFAIYGACVHMRLLFFFVCVFAPLLAVLLARWVPRYEASKDRYFLNAALIVLVSAAMVRYFPAKQELQKVIARGFPAGAVDYLQEHSVAGPMFNDDFWGDYLMRKLGPAHKTFIDGRSQLYEEAGVFADYLRIIDIDPQTQLLLLKYGVNACLIQRHAPLATLFAASADWKRVYQDDLSVLFVRRQPIPPPE